LNTTPAWAGFNPSNTTNPSGIIESKCLSQNHSTAPEALVDAKEEIVNKWAVWIGQKFYCLL
jgi:hypothetical protein